MGTAKRTLAAGKVTAITPAAAANVKVRVVGELVRLGGLAASDAEKIYDRSVVAKNLPTLPGPFLHEDPGYLAEVILAQEGLPSLLH